MNLDALKSGFISYLQEKLAETNPEKEEQVKDSDISIFMYSSEFKDYLVEEIGVDSSIASKSLGEIMSMDLVNGKLVDSDEDSNSDSFETQNVSASGNALWGDKTNINDTEIDKIPNLDEEAMTEFIDSVSNLDKESMITETDEAETGIDAGLLGDENKIAGSIADVDAPQLAGSESSQNIINRLLEKVYSDEKALEILDEDGDGKLSDEEKEKFENFIKGYDGDNSGELSEADIKRAFDDIKNGTFSYDADLEEVSKEIDEKVEEELAEKEAAKSSSTSKPSSGSSVQSSGGGGTSGSSNSFSSSNATETKSVENMSLEELESKKTEKEGEVAEAQADVNAVYSGENEAVAAAEEECEEAKEAYDEAVENDENISDELKEQREENLEAISDQEKVIDDLNIDINDKDSEISAQNSVIDADKSNLEALKSAQSQLTGQTSDDPEKQAEIESKKAELESQISAAETQLSEDEATLEKLEGEKEELEEKLEEEEEKLTELEAEKAEIEAEIEKVCAPETKEAMQAYNEAKENVETVKEAELQTAQEKLTTVQGELEEINNQINVKKAEKTEKEYSVSDFDFDFDLNLSDVQENELEAFKKNWEENKDKYEAVEEATGMPAELVAAIHWREGSGNFNTYLHNGQQLGQTTTIVPEGIYFEDWTEAAIDAVTNYGTDLSTIDPDDISTYYNYAEHYNGMGYANKGLPSPYVWAGTSNYEKGKYVADGQFDPNYVDQQLGVAVMLRALLE